MIPDYYTRDYWPVINGHAYLYRSTIYISIISNTYMVCFNKCCRRQSRFIFNRSLFWNNKKKKMLQCKILPHFMLIVLSLSAASSSQHIPSDDDGQHHRENSVRFFCLTVSYHM